MEKVNTPDGKMHVAGLLYKFVGYFIDCAVIFLVFLWVVVLFELPVTELPLWATWVPGALIIVYMILASRHKVPSLGNWALALDLYPNSEIEGYVGKGNVRLVKDLSTGARSGRLITATAVIAVLFSGIFWMDSPRNSGSGATEGYISSIDEARLYYRVMGAEEDTLVVVHGGPGAGMHSVIPMMEPLAESFTLIFYDQRGGGRSTLPEDTTKLQPRHFVEDMEAVREHFSLDRMNVITHSFGSILMAEYAKEYPDRLRRMVFHGATGPRRSDMARLYRARAAEAPPSPDTALSNRASELLRSLLNGTASDPLEACREYEAISMQLLIARGDSTNYEGTICNAPPEAIQYYYQYTAQLAPRYFGAWDYTTGLEQVDAPLLVVYGEEDSLAIPTQQQWADAVPDGRLLLVPGVEKSVLSDKPEIAVPAIIKFFKGNDFEHTGAMEARTPPSRIPDYEIHSESIP